MSDTPRTDHAFNDEYCYDEYVSKEFAQQLERELAEVKEQLRLCNVDQFTTAAELAEAVTKERERCAKVCEEILHPDESAEIEERANWYAGTWACAAAIKRGE